MKKLVLALSVILSACFGSSDKVSPGEKLRKGAYSKNPKRFTLKEIAKNNALVAKHIDIRLNSIKWAFHKDYGRQMPWFVWQVQNNTGEEIKDIQALVIEHFKMTAKDTSVFFGALGTYNLFLDKSTIKPGETYLIKSWPDNTNARQIDDATTLAFYFDNVSYTTLNGEKKQVPLAIHYVDTTGMQRIN